MASQSDMQILSKYFMETDNIPKEVRQAFVRIQQRVQSMSNDESKTDEEGSKPSTDYNKSKKSNLLTRDVIMKNKWLFYNENGYLGEMTFDNSGKIKGYNSRNERTWRLSEGAYGHAILELYGDGNKRTCQFISTILDGTGKWRLQGPYEPNKHWKHYLHQV